MKTMEDWVYQRSVERGLCLTMSEAAERIDWTMNDFLQMEVEPVIGCSACLMSMSIFSGYYDVMGSFFCRKCAGVE